MDLNSVGVLITESLNEVQPAVYRAALKLRSLQKLCHMHLVSLNDLHPVLSTFRRSGDTVVGLVREDLKLHLEELFQGVSRDLPDQAVPDATDQTCRLLFKLFDREHSGFILLRSVEAALIALCGDTLTAKHRALFRLAESYSRSEENEENSINLDALRVLLEDLSQVPAAVQENLVFGLTETAVSSCFSGVTSPRLSEEQFIGWLQSEPRLLLWLSTLYRISVSEAVQHRVRCHTCKAFPITGLRYRCLKCLNVHVCQSCFLTERRSRKHKPGHPVLEYCTQPSWKESLASLASSTRLALVPRHTRREAERRRGLRAEQHHSGSSPALQSAADPDVLNAAEPTLTAAVTVESKSLQTEETPQIMQNETAELQKDLSVTQRAMKDLQRDKWLLEKEFQVWRVAAQSEHDSLEDKCSELKDMMGTLNQHNQLLEEQLQSLRELMNQKDRTDPSLSKINPEHDDGFSESTWTQTHLPFTGEHEQRMEILEQRVEVEEDTLYDVSEDISTNLDDADSVLTQTDQEQLEEVQEEEELLEDEEELQYDRPLNIGSMFALDQDEDSGSDGSEKDEEEELCELVQRLRNELSLFTASGLMSVERELLLKAAEGVRDSVSQLVTSVKSSHGV